MKKEPLEMTPEQRQTLASLVAKLKAYLQAQPRQAEGLPPEIVDVAFETSGLMEGTTFCRINPEICEAYNMLGLFNSRALRNFDRAEMYLSFVRDLCIDGEFDVSTTQYADCLEFYVDLFLHDGDRESAIEYLEECRDIRKKVLGASHPETERTRRMLAELKGRSPGKQRVN